MKKIQISTENQVTLDGMMTIGKLETGGRHRPESAAGAAPCRGKLETVRHGVVNTG